MTSNNEVKVFFTGDTKGFEKATATVANKSSGLKKTLLGIGAGVSLAALGKGVLDTAKHFEEASLSARDFAKVAGVSGTDAARWQEAANSIGVDADVVQNAFAKMNAAIGTDAVKAGDKLDKAKDSNKAATQRVQKAQERYNQAVAKSGKDSDSAKRAADSLHAAQEKLAKSGEKVKDIATQGTGAFADFGIQIVKTKDGMVDTNATFLNAIEFLKNEKDATVADAAAKKIFGRSFQDLTPLILQGKAGLESQLAHVSATQAGVGSADSIAKAERFQAALDNLGDRFEQLKLKLGVGLVPVLATFFNWLSRIPAPAFAIAAGFLAFIVAVGRLNAALNILSANPWAIVLAGAILLLVLLVKNWDAVTAAVGRAEAAVRHFFASLPGAGPLAKLLHIGNNSDSSAAPGYDPTTYRKLPGYALGGIVSGALGAPQLAIVHGGERVLTPDQQQGAGAMNFYGPMNFYGVQDIRSLRVALQRDVDRQSRGGG